MSEIGMKANMCFRIEKPHQFNTFQYMRAFCGAILQYALHALALQDARDAEQS